MFANTPLESAPGEQYAYSNLGYSLLAAVIVNSVNFCSNERAQEVEAFFAANPVPQCSRRIAQLLEGMRNSGAILENVRSTKLATAGFWQ